MNTPSVLFVIFRRPEATARVFEAIRRARPSRLFVAADGPRPGRQDEAELCRQTRAVVERVDWPCQVVTRFQETNQGIKEGVTGAISWFFSQVDEGIILEDDCLPHPDFFPYCAALLKQYRDDERVFHVGGNNFQPKSRVMAESYYFSRYNHIWGWATWKRAWDRYRAEFEGLEDFLVEADRTGFWDSAREQTYWSKMFRRTRDGRVITWDYQWTYTMWAEGALAVTPRSNLVANIGFGHGATNVAEAKDQEGQRPLEPLGTVTVNPWPIRYRAAVRYTFTNKFWGMPVDRLRLRLRQAGAMLRRFGGRRP